MKRSTIILTLAVILAVGLLGAGLLAMSYHRVAVVDGVAYQPLGHAYVSVTLASGESVDIGEADEDGKLAFWTAPWKFPQEICAGYLFFSPNCVGAVSLVRQRIELAVP